MWSTGIDPIMGAIPECKDHFDSKNFSVVCAPIDHYAVIKGIPLGSKGSLTRDYKPIHIPVVGSLYKKETIPGISYANIELTTTIRDGIIAEITPELNVTLNGVLIAVSPKLTTTKTGKEKARSQSEKLRFCKAVVWALVHDENCLNDKLSEIGYVSPVKECEINIDHIVENITLSPFPGPGIVEEIEYTEMYAYRQKERDDRETIIKEYDDDPEESPYEITGAYLNPENNPESADEIINAFCKKPISPGTYYPHIRCYIQEVPV